MPQRHISVLMADDPYFYRHCLSYHISILIFSTILAIKEVTILGLKIFESIEWQNAGQSRGVRGHAPPENF